MRTEDLAQKIVELLSGFGATEKFLAFVLGIMGTEDSAQNMIELLSGFGPIKKFLALVIIVYDRIARVSRKRYDVNLNGLRRNFNLVLTLYLLVYVSQISHDHIRPTTNSIERFYT